MTGVIISIKADRGFAFVMPDGCDCRRDAHFLHRSRLVDSYFDNLKVGQRVEFDSVPEPRGLAAHNVRLAHT